MTATETCPRCADPMKAHDTSPRCRYNGWKNYETWAVALWLDNEQGTHEAAREMARDTYENASERNRVPVWTSEQYARYTLADSLKAWVTDDMMPDLGASLAADLLGAALSEVDWNEIAEHYLDDAKEEAAR